jgi:hypothetical protein
LVLGSLFIQKTTIGNHQSSINTVKLRSGDSISLTILDM